MPLKKQIRQEKIFWCVSKSYDPINLLLLLGPVQRNLAALYSHISQLQVNNLRLETRNLTMQFPFV